MSNRRRRKRARNHASTFDPQFLKHRVMIATGLLVVCLFVAAGAVDRVVKELGSPYVAAVISAILVDLANADRTELALPQLTASSALTAAAQAKADDMARKGYFSHTTPEGHDSWHWFELVGYNYIHAGENLAVNFSDSVEVEQAWMQSPTHRDNIVNPKYTEIGIATAAGMYQGKETVFVVQMFGMPKAEAAVAAEPLTSPLASVAAEETATESVLGETVTEVVPSREFSDSLGAGAPHEEASIGALAEQDGDAAVLSPEEIPWWGFLLAQPKQTLQYAYYIIGLFILVALFFDIEWELHKHHVRHAMKAGMLLATMSMLFVIADWIFFAEPVLAMLGVM